MNNISHNKNNNNITVSNFVANLNVPNVNSFENIKYNNNINDNNINNNNINLNNNIIINEEEEKKSCWFCYGTNPDLDKKFILYEYNYIYLSLSKGPINKYHFLLIPKRHISFYENLTNDEKIECEMIVKILKCFLDSIGYDYIIYEKNLKYNFNKGIHMLINIIGVEKVYIPKLNEFTENFLIEEKINNYSVSYNEDKDIYLYTSCKNEEYIYINIPKVIKDKIIRKLIFIPSKEYKIDHPRKLICSLINKEERINWRNTLNLGDEFLDELIKEVENFMNDYFSNDK
jgi:diadenosine tetraphosphate (Ap4A) HIT family hydrolase